MFGGGFGEYVDVGVPVRYLELLGGYAGRSRVSGTCLGRIFGRISEAFGRHLDGVWEVSAT